MKRSVKLISLSAVAAIIFSAFTFYEVRSASFKKLTAPQSLTSEAFASLENLLHKNYSGQFNTLKPLPYKISTPDFDLFAEASILIDVSNGNILYEKDADRIIPPASMTKLFAMYVVEQEVALGNFTWDQYIPLPPECWACNMPPDSSLMFLGKGQKVTLRELMTGLAVCSGNDAAYAVAYAICGNMEDFVQRMNDVAKDAGLVQTHFVESSGYSEKNLTTPREMAMFACRYLQEFPESIKNFHSVQSFTYPEEHNLASGDVQAVQDFSTGFPEHITMPITQKNTNPLLGKMEGCDGLKTGYIDESGYNLSLTAERGGTRFLSVTMKGSGNTVAEGQAGRVHDGTMLMEWAFSSFADLKENFSTVYFVRDFGATQKGVNLVPAFPVHTVTVPHILQKDMQENVAAVKIYTEIPSALYGQVIQGAEYGKITVMLQDHVLQEIPLVADRNTEKGNIFVTAADKLIIKQYE